MLRRNVVAVLVMGFLAPLSASAQVGLNVDVEAKVREYFADTPVMIEIARCESKFRQFTDAGNPLYGGYGRGMVGVFQLYEDIHGDSARGKGMDITTLDGNIAYAKYLYEREGTQPWMSSFPCWGTELSVSADATASPTGLSVNLSFGMEHPQVLVLQKLLNEKGFTIASDGPGSPGNETQKFGSLTRVAVRKFQCEAMQICSGDEYSNGYGYVGTKTRLALAEKGVAATPPAPASTPVVMAPSTEASTYSIEDQAKIAALKARILELTKALNALLGNS